MKKNWFPIALLVAFIAGWEIFVLRPHYEKEALTKRALVEAQKASQALHGGLSVQSAVPGAPASATQTTVTSGSPKVEPMSEQARKTFASVALSDQRSVQIFGDASVGAASFNDYFVRERKDRVPVVLLNDAFRWASSDPTVNECFSKLGVGSDGKTFSAKTASGAICEIRYTPDASKPGLLSATLLLKGFAPTTSGVVEFRGIDTPGTGPAQDHNFLSYKVDGSKKKILDKKLLEPTRIEGKIDWLLWGDRYFSSALIPRGKFNPNVVYSVANPEAKNVSFGFQYPLLLNAPEGATYEFDIFFGTRDVESLAKIKEDLPEAVELGIAGAVAKVMLWALKTLNLAFHNFGVSIIVLTLLVRLGFWPLNKKVYQSGLKMKKLQPEVERLKAKYGSDKSKASEMNVEMMALYKKHNVNPMGSCLPLLFQMPIFFGLYGALNHSLDLYQAPFFGWITDLSSRDHFFVFPVLWTMTLLGYAQLNPQAQQGNSQNGMPDMKWIMMGMNVFFGYLSKDWPAGLTLYLFVSNLVGISQQFMMQRASKLQPIQEGA